MRVHRFIVEIEDEDEIGPENTQSELTFAIDALIGSAGGVQYVDTRDYAA